MTLTIRERALAAVEVLLATIPGVAKVGRNVPYALAADELPALLIEDGPERKQAQQSQGSLRIVQQIRISARFLATNQDSIGQAASEWYGKVRTAVGSDYTLGGLVMSVDYDSADEPVFVPGPSNPYGEIAIIFEILREEGELNPFASF